MTVRDSAAGTSQVCPCTHTPRGCPDTGSRTHVHADDRTSGCLQPLLFMVPCRPAGRYLGFLWLEWFPFKLSEELDFHIMGCAKRHCVFFVVFCFMLPRSGPLLAVYNVICFLCSRARCPVLRHHARHNTLLATGPLQTKTVAGIKQSLTEAAL